MGGKVVASYLVRVTLREPDGFVEGETDAVVAPTNSDIVDALVGVLEDLTEGTVKATATSERLDQ